MFAIEISDDAELRPLEVWQLDEFFAHIQRARKQVDRWIRFAAGAADLNSARDTLQRYADRQAADTGRLFGIWHQHVLVGGCMYPHFDAQSGNCEIGVWTEPAGQGHGFVTTSVRILLDHALIERGLARAEWHCDPRNERSVAVAKRVGMTAEGILRSSYLHNGERQDMQVWAILQDEWAAVRDEW
ncbi:GNAT family N-acetyltransferase [Catenulispora pinisilvae]|uniref:GNAT family N-acetyltransferase n=1 Tax=Catenulispora pinisilvae TaxID=2705253 RepID=UPI001890C862|nr:GNAT family protein [Catenulispora pinisilvae]